MWWPRWLFLFEALQPQKLELATQYLVLSEQTGHAKNMNIICHLLVFPCVASFTIHLPNLSVNIKHPKDHAQAFIPLGKWKVPMRNHSNWGLSHENTGFTTAHHDPWPNCLALDHRGAVVPSIADDLLQGLMTCAYYKYQKDAGLSSK